MDEIKKALQALTIRIKDIENAFYNIKTLVFPLGSGKLRIPRYSSDPSSPEDGDIWYNTTSNTYKGRENGVVVTFTTS